ncbi:MAG: hypothetical protein KAV87_65015 [Desulfobacteraceae bacterium]|nr:hypothetical protein [Desulfobacteraceae bacterium]
MKGKKYKFKLDDRVVTKKDRVLTVIKRYKIKIDGEIYNSYLINEKLEYTTHAREEELRLLV